MWWDFSYQCSLLRTWRQAYPRLVFIETEVIPSPSTNNAHTVIAQYHVVGLFATVPSSTTTLAASWLLHIASQVAGTALVAASGQFLELSTLLESLFVRLPGSLLSSDHVCWECSGISVQSFDDMV